VQVSRWLVGIKRLVEEVENVEAPLSPSSDCHSDVQSSSLCSVQPLPVPSNCPSLIAADCQSTGAAGALLDVSGHTEADVQMTPVGNSNVAVSSCGASLASDVDTEHAVASLAGCDLTSDNICPDFTSRLNVQDSGADKKSSSSPTDTASSLNEPDTLPPVETQVTSDNVETSVTSADTSNVQS